MSQVLPTDINDYQDANGARVVRFCREHKTIAGRWFSNDATASAKLTIELT
ncbi:MAG: hypothetical protein ACO3TX_13695 [Pseudomonadales bacterium]|jgi:hypothetical protein